MERARVDEGVRRMRFEDLSSRHEREEIGQEGVAELLGISERTFRRWRDRYREEGWQGLGDGRLGPSDRRASEAEIARMEGLYRDRCAGFTVKHFHEQPLKRHDCVLGSGLYGDEGSRRAGLVQKAPKRSAHRKKRPRRPMVGMSRTRTPRATPGCRGGPAGRSGGDARRCDERHLFGLPGGRGGRMLRICSQKARPRPSGACARWSSGAGCFVRSTPTGAVTIFIRRGPAGRSPRRS